MLNIAHRGASASYPENTLKSIEEAIHMGADMIEIDLKISKDGYVMVFHDETVDRLTNGQGYIRDMTVREPKSLNVGNSEKIPTIEEAIEVVSEKAGLMLDISDDSALGGHEKSVVKIIHQYRMDDNVLFCGAHVPLRVIKTLNPSLRTAPTFREALSENLLEAVAMKASVFNVYYPSLAPLFVKEAHEHKLKVTAWVVDNCSDMHELIRMGVDGLITNYPDILRKILQTIN